MVVLRFLVEPSVKFPTVGFAVESLTADFAQEFQDFLGFGLDVAFGWWHYFLAFRGTGISLHPAEIACANFSVGTLSIATRHFSW
jgi:hypothetical protein